MDIERLASKLEPLMPETVRKWMHARDSGNLALRALIDRQIASTAERAFGGVRGRVVLSLPPEDRSGGEFNLGTVLYEKEKWPLGISRSELLQNLAIFGRSGAGKTNVVFHLLKQLAQRNIKFLFLDWKRTARHLTPYLDKPVSIATPGRSLAPFAFNPFVHPPGLEAEVYADLVVDVLADAFTLGDGSRSVLLKALLACYHKGQDPRCRDVLRELDAIPDRERVRGWKLSARRALESLESGALRSMGGMGNATAAKGLLEQSTILELDGLSQAGKKFLIPILCLWVYYVQLTSPKREELQFVIVVEEAHHVLHRSAQTGRESVMEMLLRQCREIGISIIVVDQHPHLISSAVLGNAYTSICFNLKDPSDTSKAAALSLLDEFEKRLLSDLPVGQGIVKLQDRWRKPVLVQIPHVEIRKGQMTDTLLNRYIETSRTLSGFKGFVELYNAGIGRSRSADYVLDREGVRVLQDVVRNPLDGVDVRYKRLGLSAERGTRIKRGLEASGLVSSHTVRVGNTRRVVLRLTPKGMDLAVLRGRGQDGSAGRHGDDSGDDNADRDGANGWTDVDSRTGGATQAARSLIPGHPRNTESVLHDFWKHRYAEKLRELGYRIEIEAPRPHGVLGRTDILATRASESVAVEIETGKSNVVENVRQNLRAGVSRVLVLAVDKSASRRVEGQLARAGLLGLGGRVEVRIAA